MARRRTPRLRLVLLAVNLIVVLLPLAGIWSLRLYEQMLVRQTEGELVAQGAFVAAIYRDALRKHLAESDVAVYGEPVSALRDTSGSWGRSLTPTPGADAVLRNTSGPRGRSFSPTPGADAALTPISPIIDLTIDEVRPPAPEPLETDRTADIRARAAGADIMTILDEARRVMLAGIRVVDPSGIVVSTTRSELGMDLSHREEVWRALDGETVRLLRDRISDEPDPPPWSISRAADMRVFVALPIFEGERLWGAVVLSRTPMSMWQGLWGIRWQLAFGAFTTLLVVLLVSSFTSRRVSRPVNALIRQAEAVMEGDLDAATPLERPGTKEIGLLSDAFSRMANTLEERAQYIRSFAAHVSHEFKTPLTSIQGTVELLRDHLDEMSEQERSRFLTILAADAERLDRLVRRLLELARADVARPGQERTEVCPILEGLVDRFAALGLDVSLEAEGAQGLRVAMQPEMLESILANLLDNAQQHGGPEVSVRVGLRGTPTTVELKVTDDGPGISEANLERVRTPFFTTARDRGGSGLGLSIVDSLATAHGGTLAVVSDRSGTTLSVRLPRVLGG